MGEILLHVAPPLHLATLPWCTLGVSLLSLEILKFTVLFWEKVRWMLVDTHDFEL